MKGKSLKEIADWTNAEVIGKTEEKSISQIYFDTRKIIHSKGAVFIALTTEKDDGHNYLDKAYEKGIRIFIISKNISPKENAVYLKVENSLKAIQNCAKEYRKTLNIPIVGITGSNGKTIIKEWAFDLLGQKKEVYRSPKSYNSQLGVPLSILEIEPFHKLAFIEVGISKPGEMEVLEEIVKPDIGVFTNIGHAHSENFDSLDSKIKEKAKLFKTSKTIIYNLSDKNIESELNQFENKEKITLGKEDNADLEIIRENIGIESSEVEILLKNNTYHLKVEIGSNAYIQNFYFSFLIASQFIKSEEILQNISNISPLEMRLELSEGQSNSVLINDSYSMDFESMIEAVEFLALQPQKEKGLVTSSLSNILKEPEKKELFFKLLGEKEINFIYQIGKNPLEISQTNSKNFSSLEEFKKKIEPNTFLNSAVLIKGYRIDKLEEIFRYLQKKFHATYLEINLRAALDNYKFFKSKLKPKTKIMAMVKAISYGSGSYEMANALQSVGVDYLGVAYIDEGIELRKNGITTPILVLNPDPNYLKLCLEYNLEIEIYSLSLLKYFISQKMFEIPIHLKIDTGMHRLGLSKEEIEEVIELIKVNPKLKLKSCFSHLSSSDDLAEKEFTLKQIKLFEKITETIKSKTKKSFFRHILNTSGIVHYSEFQFDMVRLGIGLYGVSGNENIQSELKNVSTLKSRITQIRWIEKGESVGYSRRFKAQEKTKIGVIPIGYADGYPRGLGNEKSYVIISGKPAKVIGSVCMDMLMVNLNEIDCNEGDEVIIFGEKPTVKELAETLETIPYEILTNISDRVKRRFVYS